MAGGDRGAAAARAPGPAATAGPSASELRASVLGVLLDPAPAQFPQVGKTLLISGALEVGATALQEASPLGVGAAVGGGSGAAAALVKPGRLPYPRLAAVLRLDTAAALAVLGRLFTASADAVLAAAWLVEGWPGAIARHRCVPGEWPALGGPASKVELRMQLPPPPPPPPADQRRAAASKAPVPQPPDVSLLDLLQAISEVAVAMAAAESSAARQAGLTGALPPRRGGGPTSQLPSLLALDVTATTASPRLALLLLFIAFQCGRLGPGMPPIVHPPSCCDDDGRETGGDAAALALRYAILYLSSPAPPNKRVAGVVPGGSGALNDSTWVLHDAVVGVFVSFTRR
jgi:hypothetical protein